MKLLLEVDSADLIRAAEVAIGKATSELTGEMITEKIEAIIQLKAFRLLTDVRLEGLVQEAIDTAVTRMTTDPKTRVAVTAAIVSAARELVRGGPGK